MPVSTLGFVVPCALVLLLSGLAVAQEDDIAPADWPELQATARSLLGEEKYDEALDLVERFAPELQDREFEVSDLTFAILLAAGRTDEALTVWEEGMDAGFFYFVVPRLPLYDAVRNDDRFRKAVARNNSLRDRASRKSKPEYEVIPPAAYSENGSYPLVMIIHGGNQSIVKAKERWDPQAFGDDLIIAYVQSSRRADTRSYRWDLGGVDIYSLPTAQEEVLGLYRAIVENYAVDTERVTLAGFSQGGNLALFLAAEGRIPARGFIAGCPATRSPVSLPTARSAAGRGVRGTIFVGADDWTAAAAQSSVDHFKEAGLSANHIVMEGKGHEFPDDFEQVLREATRQIRQ